MDNAVIPQAQLLDHDSNRLRQVFEKMIKHQAFGVGFRLEKYVLKKLQYLTMKIWFKHGGAILPKSVANSAYRLATKPPRHYPNKIDNTTLLHHAIVINENFDNHKVHGYMWGTGDKLVLLLHGWNSHALSMRNFIPPLLKKGYKVLAFDAPGHGHSDSIYSGTAYKNMVGSVIEQYQPQIIIAHSVGGLNALLELATKPITSVKKVITIGTPYDATYAIKHYMTLLSLHRFARKHFWRKLLRKWRINLSKFDLRNIYATDNLNIDGLIIHDINDEIIPYQHAVEIQNIWPRARIVTTHGLGHSKILKNKSVVEQIIKFIE